MSEPGRWEAIAETALDAGAALLQLLVVSVALGVLAAGPLTAARLLRRSR